MRLHHVRPPIFIKIEAHRVLDQRFRRKNLRLKGWRETQFLQCHIQFGTVTASRSDRFGCVQRNECTKE